MESSFIMLSSYMSKQTIKHGHIWSITLIDSYACVCTTCPMTVWPPDPSTLISVISISVAIMIYSLLGFFDGLSNVNCLLFGLWLEKACRQKGAPNMLLFQQVLLSLGTQWHESRTSVLIKKGDEQHSAWITVGVWTFNRRFNTFLTVWTFIVLFCWRNTSGNSRATFSRPVIRDR